MSASTLRDQLKAAREKLFPRDGPSCGQKKRYVDRSEAEAVRGKREKRAGHQIWKYACSRCGGWHLTKFKQEK